MFCFRRPPSKSRPSKPPVRSQNRHLDFISLPSPPSSHQGALGQFYFSSTFFFKDEKEQSTQSSQGSTRRPSKQKHDHTVKGALLKRQRARHHRRPSCRRDPTGKTRMPQHRRELQRSNQSAVSAVCVCCVCWPESNGAELAQTRWPESLA